MEILIRLTILIIIVIVYFETYTYMNIVLRMTGIICIASLFIIIMKFVSKKLEHQLEHQEHKSESNNRYESKYNVDTLPDRSESDNRYEFEYNIDTLFDGYEFESYIANMLERNGYSVEKTPKSGDYGTDVIAEKDMIKYAIQCKYYSQPVGVAAVRKAASGKDFYDCHVAVVATNNIFTPNAKMLAKKVNVVFVGKTRHSKNG